MPWIRIEPPEEATGLLARIYTAARRRAGKIFHVLQIQSLQPRALQISTELYTHLMTDPHEPLSRRQREMIATAVSRANACAY